jgi:hypothetical protein
VENIIKCVHKGKCVRQDTHINRERRGAEKTHEYTNGVDVFGSIGHVLPHRHVFCSGSC